MVCPFAVFFSPFLRRAKAELKRSTRPSKKEKEIKIHITFSEQQSNNKKGLFSPSLPNECPFLTFLARESKKEAEETLQKLVSRSEKEKAEEENCPLPPSPSFFPWGVPPPFYCLGWG